MFLKEKFLGLFLFLNFFLPLNEDFFFLTLASSSGFFQNILDYLYSQRFFLILNLDFLESSF